MKIPFLLTENLLGQWMIEQHAAFQYIEKLFDLPINLFELKERGEFVFSIATEFSIQAASGIDGAKTTFDKAPKGSVAIIPLTGVFLKYGTDYNFGTSEIAQFVMAAANSKNIEAILFDVDSGGGAANSINPLLSAINYAKTKKPVCAIADRAASAAYYVIAGCDFIMAENDITSSFGSIGVMTSFKSFAPFLEKHGITSRNIYAPESDHKNSAVEAAEKGDDSLIKSEILSPLAVQFQNHVKASRSGKLNEAIPGILAGKMFYANDAKKHGLIDSIGNLPQAIEKALLLADVKKFMNS